MKVALYGSTGKSGSRILHELLTRDHQVVAIVRGQSKPQPANGLSIKQDDLSDAGRTAEVIQGSDAMISAYAPPQDNTDELLRVTRLQIDAVKKAGVNRLLVDGGAGGLEVAPGVSLIESNLLPDAYLPIANSHVKALKLLESSDIDWTYLAPAAFFEPGQRTGKFRLGKNELISDDRRESRISMEDYAIALVDELENPSRRKQRFSIGY